MKKFFIFEKKPCTQNVPEKPSMQFWSPCRKLFEWKPKNFPSMFEIEHNRSFQKIWFYSKFSYWHVECGYDNSAEILSVKVRKGMISFSEEKLFILKKSSMDTLNAVLTTCSKNFLLNVQNDIKNYVFQNFFLKLSIWALKMQCSQPRKKFRQKAENCWLMVWRSWKKNFSIKHVSSKCSYGHVEWSFH